MAQRQFRSDDTSAWLDRYGLGSESPLTISGNTTDAPIDSACTGTSGTTSLSATNVNFAAGQPLLIHQSSGNTANIGNWELNKIQSYTAGTITLSYSLIYSYVTGAQVLVLKQYPSVTINNGVTLAGKAYTGSVGGIIAYMASGSFTNNGTITVVGKGRGGGPSRTGQVTSDDSTSYQGTSYIGSGTKSRSANGNAGGGGTHWGAIAGGGGGGYGTAGGNGVLGQGSTGYGVGGAAFGVASMVTCLFGGSGGGGAQGADQSSPGGAGATSAGLIFIFSPTIDLSNGITTANGTNGATATGGGGGGSSGGGILLKGSNIIIGTNKVTAATSSGGTGTSGGGNGGAGGAGRIHIDYGGSYTGTTTPTLDATQDATLLAGGAGSLFFAQL